MGIQPLSTALSDNTGPARVARGRQVVTSVGRPIGGWKLGRRIPERARSGGGGRRGVHGRRGHLSGRFSRPPPPAPRSIG